MINWWNPAVPTYGTGTDNKRYTFLQCVGQKLRDWGVEEFHAPVVTGCDEPGGVDVWAR